LILDWDNFIVYFRFRRSLLLLRGNKTKISTGAECFASTTGANLLVHCWQEFIACAGWMMLSCNFKRTFDHPTAPSTPFLRDCAHGVDQLNIVRGFDIASLDLKKVSELAWKRHGFSYEPGLGLATANASELTVRQARTAWLPSGGALGWPFLFATI
jgi:hypothetical protein